ncbi:hypothetical protein CEE36_11010 [candidate division TA06 bacterium B3_TA06]|uniref:histidine kinase n=1 Tax=candidate division TA06 bacterium B3_TA06 TaxID=2012487 RepID=A0A532URU3_UNCT6|nr:MAG: hypothetical protein CEE36_11010 [candidate division TA06 bacterium B3_TA06]
MFKRLSSLTYRKIKRSLKRDEVQELLDISAKMYGFPLRVIDFETQEPHRTERITLWVYHSNFFDWIDKECPASNEEVDNDVCRKHRQVLIEASQGKFSHCPIKCGTTEFALSLGHDYPADNKTFLLVGGRGWLVPDDLEPKDYPLWQQKIEAALEEAKKQKQLAPHKARAYEFRARRRPFRTVEELEISAREIVNILNLFLEYYSLDSRCPEISSKIFKDITESLYIWVGMEKYVKKLLKDVKKLFPEGLTPLTLVGSRRGYPDTGFALYSSGGIESILFSSAEVLRECLGKKEKTNEELQEKVSEALADRLQGRELLAIEKLKLVDDRQKGCIVITSHDGKSFWKSRDRKAAEKMADFLAGQTSNYLDLLKEQAGRQHETSNKLSFYRLKRRLRTGIGDAYSREKIEEVIEGEGILDHLDLDSIRLHRVEYHTYEEQKGAKPWLQKVLDAGGANYFPNQETREQIYVPVFFRNTITDVIEAASKRSISQKTEEALMELAHHISPRLEYDRLAKNLGTFKSAFKDLPRDKNPIAADICRMISASGCSIWLQETSSSFSRIAQIGVEHGIDEIGLEKSSLIKKLLDRGMSEPPYELVDVEKTDYLLTQKELLKQEYKFGLGAIASIPREYMKRDFNLVVTVWRKDQGFTDEEAEILTAFAQGLVASEGLRKKAEQHAHEIEETITRLLHEVKAPTNALIANIYDIQDLINYNRRRLTPTFLKDIGFPLGDIRILGRYMKALNDDFSLFTSLLGRTSPTHYEPPSVVWLYDRLKELQEILAFQAKQNNLKIKIIAESDKLRRDIALRLTRNQKLAFEVILFNLLTNAYRYAKKRSVCFIRLDLSPHKDLLIYVENTGIGILEDEKKLIFEKGTRGSKAIEVQPTGTGYGLWIAQTAARRLGREGEVSLISANPERTVFLFRLPQNFISWKERKREKVENSQGGSHG